MILDNWKRVSSKSEATSNFQLAWTPTSIHAPNNIAAYSWLNYDVEKYHLLYLRIYNMHHAFLTRYASYMYSNLQNYHALKPRATHRVLTPLICMYSHHTYSLKEPIMKFIPKQVGAKSRTDAALWPPTQLNSMFLSVWCKWWTLHEFYFDSSWIFLRKFWQMWLIR
jgi:hypothetical protein